MTGNEFDRSTVNPQREVARVFPADMVACLRAASMRIGTEADRMKAIDAVTDELVRRGLCRPRHELSNRF